MSKPYTVPIGKTIQRLAKLRGGGSSLPGLVVEKIDPDFVRYTLGQLPMGIVIISGSNGKTTTTKMVVELLESQGLKVFTNRTGSNFVRGVAAALLSEVDSKGILGADIGVLELDEAHGVRFVEAIQPEYVLLLNVMRDQLDRFGEVDTIAKLVETIARTAKQGVVLNRDDPRLAAMQFKVPVHTFGTSSDLRSLFPSDDDLHHTARKSPRSKNHATNDVSLEQLAGQKATIRFPEKEITSELKINGIYNVLNAVAALALTRLIMGDELDEAVLLQRLATITPAFGRGEQFIIDGQPVELILVKNPAGFRLSLASFPASGHKTMIAINDNYADGRDMSWLWDVDFSSLAPTGVSVVGGIRAYDMALRLQYDEVPITLVVPGLTHALQQFLKETTGRPKHIFCTYTAMLTVRRELSKLATKEENI